MKINKKDICLLFVILTTMTACTADDVPVGVMASIVGFIALVFYGIAVSMVFLGRKWRAYTKIFKPDNVIAVSFLVFFGSNGLLVMADPEIAAIAFFLVLLCVLGGNLGFFLSDIKSALVILFIVTALLWLICLFDIYRPHGLLSSLANVFRSF